MAEIITRNSARIALKYCIWGGLIPTPVLLGADGQGNRSHGRDEGKPEEAHLYLAFTRVHLDHCALLWGLKTRNCTIIQLINTSEPPCTSAWKWLHMEQLPGIRMGAQKAGPEIRVVSQNGRTNDSLPAQLKIRMSCTERF